MYILSSTFRKMLFGWKLFAICVIIFSSNLGEQFSLFLAKKVQTFSRYCFLAFFFCIKFFFFFFSPVFMMFFHCSHGFGNLEWYSKSKKNTVVARD